ncbi:MAG: hypothetical protein JNJ69_02530 [Leptospiraceae bacterium]|nr:hypothetical protein [Leptospiraceae bacterium]
MVFRFAAVAFCCMLPFSACLTTRNSKAIREQKSAINEFDLTLPQNGNYRITAGTMSVQNGLTTLQFEGVLSGAGRVLNVESTAQGIMFYETRGALSPGTRVFLITQITCCMNDNAFREILFLKAGQKANAAEMLRRHFGYETGNLENPTAILVMDFSNVYTFSAMHAVWKTADEVAYFSQAPGTDYNDVMQRIAWEKRSKASIAALYGWYGVTVPVDIVTGPVQLIMLLLYGYGMAK